VVKEIVSLPAGSRSLVGVRRPLSIALLIFAGAVGVAVGLWMALLTRLPYCPARGLGTRYLCAAQPMFSARVCVLSGGAAAAFILLASLAVRRSLSN
jgi:hypothetical protein